MFIIHHTGIALDGTNPTILDGYGGFNIARLPSFSISRLLFMKNMGGVSAIANLRGGSEYGERWHEAGMLERKQNVFDDFIAAGEFLVKEKYTSPERYFLLFWWSQFFPAFGSIGLRNTFAAFLVFIVQKWSKNKHYFCISKYSWKENSFNIFQRFSEKWIFHWESLKLWALLILKHGGCQWGCHYLPPYTHCFWLINLIWLMFYINTVNK